MMFVFLETGKLTGGQSPKFERCSFANFLRENGRSFHFVSSPLALGFTAHAQTKKMRLSAGNLGGNSIYTTRVACRNLFTTQSPNYVLYDGSM